MSLKRSYAVLNLAPGVGLEEVKKAFRALAFKHHPDLHPDMPDASRRFQEVNEAYIAVSRHLQSGPARDRPEGGKRPGRPKPPPSDSSKWANAKKTWQAAGRAKTAHFEYRRQAAYQREEILRDLLRDPFARQVYEDIYSQVRESGRGGPATVEEHAKKVLRVEWGAKKLELDLSRGFKERVADWLKHQLDDEQTVYFPATQLLPGRTVRIQIRQGWRAPAATLDISLPWDFRPGQIMRLKNKGRKIGPWSGDLLLRILPKQ